MEERLRDALYAIDPATLGYDEWLNVGFALHSCGASCIEWDSWSRPDRRYKPGVCEAKWKSFGKGYANGHVTVGTIYEYAKRSGWSGMHCDEPEVFYGWSDEVTCPAHAERLIVDSAFADSGLIPEPDDGEWEQEADLREYISNVYEPDDIVNYVTAHADGKPIGRGVSMRASEMLSNIGKYKGRPDWFECAFGSYDEAAGAWIRPNPVDGKGIGNANITAFRHTLIESDEMDEARQLDIMRKLRLPISAIVSSGGKSVHAIVKVGAANEREYAERVSMIHKACDGAGLKIDRQNKNASRLSRMPGVERAHGGSLRKQWLISKRGDAPFCQSYDEWLEWYEDETDALPDAIDIAESFDDPPALAEEAIFGIIRRGHKGMLAGPSKAGKSFALIQLCVAISHGGEWLGFECARGRVLYVNLELDAASCINRFTEVSRAMGYGKPDSDTISVLNLRGHAMGADALVKPIVRRAVKCRADFIIIDPLYKVLTGDENSASDMARFCNNFDRMAEATGATIFYCHHHSKGDQMLKRAADRASGSGVFARDPDTMLDMLPLVIDERFRDAIRREFPDATDAQVQAATAWRIEGTLREFAAFEPKNVLFMWPVHTTALDMEMRRLRADGKKDAMTVAAERDQRKAEKRDEETAMLLHALESCNDDGILATTSNITERINDVSDCIIQERTVQRWLKKNEMFYPESLGRGQANVWYFKNDEDEIYGDLFNV